MKRAWVKGNKSGFFALLGIILTLVIACIIISILSKAYFKKPLLEEEAGKHLSQQGTSTSNYQSILDSAKNKVKDINDQYLNRLNQLEDVNGKEK